MERIGGGFGGKQDRPQFIAAATAIAAHCSGVPVKMVLERDTDMKITGQRHEYLIRYRVAHSADGAIEAIEAQLYSNGGFSLDLSPAVMEVALFAIDNCYHLPNSHFVGHCCRTNRPSCTAYRGFGKPQGIAAIENIIDHVARNAGIPAMEVRQRNLLHTGQTLIDGEVVDDCLERCWAPLIKMYHERRPAVDKFNAENKFRKRGLALTPAKNNIAFETDWMNQGGALIHVYTDGSVHVSHSGCEMGQGLNTKIAQVTADELGVPLAMVSVGRTASERVPNTSPTAACTGTELNAGAVVDAAR
jgi:xanthine dehydrogenase/oxidase